jgi:hypothetical protein
MVVVSVSGALTRQAAELVSPLHESHVHVLVRVVPRLQVVVMVMVMVMVMV